MAVRNADTRARRQGAGIGLLRQGLSLQEGGLSPDSLHGEDQKGRQCLGRMGWHLPKRLQGEEGRYEHWPRLGREKR